MATEIDGATRAGVGGAAAESGRLAPVVVVPAYNHGGSVARVAGAAAALGYRVVVVDDGSTDGTAARLGAWIQEADRGGARVRVVRHERNRGKAAALASGFQCAGEMLATHAVTIDADGQHEAGDIPRLLEEAARRPRALILGRRPERMAGCPARCALGRRLSSFAVLAQTGLRVSDTQCGLRVYPLDLVRAVRCAAPGFAYEAEVVARAAWAGFEVREVDVRCRYFPPGERVSHWRPARDSARQAMAHARLLVERWAARIGAGRTPGAAQAGAGVS